MRIAWIGRVTGWMAVVVGGEVLAAKGLVGLKTIRDEAGEHLLSL